MCRCQSGVCAVAMHRPPLLVRLPALSCKPSLRGIHTCGPALKHCSSSASALLTQAYPFLTFCNWTSLSPKHLTCLESHFMLSMHAQLHAPPLQEWTPTSGMTCNTFQQLARSMQMDIGRERRGWSLHVGLLTRYRYCQLCMQTGPLLALANAMLQCFCTPVPQCDLMHPSAHQFAAMSRHRPVGAAAT